VGSSFFTLSGMGGMGAVRLGPVRAADGRICSNPWEAATCSMDLKYCGGG
jgi:hypothetical protein